MVITRPGKSISGQLVECVTAPLLIIGNLWQSTKREMFSAENIYWKLLTLHKKRQAILCCCDELTQNVLYLVTQYCTQINWLTLIVFIRGFYCYQF